jgi:hypothetical protein
MLITGARCPAVTMRSVKRLRQSPGNERMIVVRSTRAERWLFRLLDDGSDCRRCTQG